MLVGDTVLAGVVFGVALGVIVGDAVRVGSAVVEGGTVVEVLPAVEVGFGLTSAQAARAIRKIAVRTQVEVRTRRSWRISRIS